MCTLTVLRDSGRLLVTMNRDDIVAREEAPPRLWPDAETDFVAPRDMQAGGTWIGVNCHGIVACLLNRYDAAPAGYVSRGRVVLEAMLGASVDTACGAVTALDHHAYSPFTCLIVGEHAATRLDWTGSHLSQTELSPTEQVMMLTSSSWQFHEVKAQREALFREIWAQHQDAGDKIAAFHCRRVGAHDAWAPMMQRQSSQTKSVIQVELSSEGAHMHYWTRDAAIDRWLTSPSASTSLARR